MKKGATPELQSHTLFPGPTQNAVRNAVIVFVVLGICLWFGGQWFAGWEMAGHRTQTLSNAMLYGTGLSEAINRRLALLRGLHAGVKTSLETGREQTARDFELFASGLYAGTHGIRNLAVAPNGVMQYVYPLQGNENVPGHDLIHDERPDVRADVQRTIDSGRTVLSGPYELRQGGLGLVAREAVYHNDAFWGLVAIVLDLPPLLQEAGIEGTSAPLQMALRDGSGTVFYGNASVFDDAPVIAHISLPDRAWELGAIPRGGWGEESRSQALRMWTFVLVIAALLAGMTYLISDRQLRLAHAVQQRTEDLARTNAALEKELADHQRTGEALGHEQHLLRTFMDNTLDFIYFKDTAGRFVRVNRAMARLVGLSIPDELIGKTDHDFFPREHCVSAAADEAHIIATGEPLISKRESETRKDGSVLWRTTTKVPIMDELGNVSGIAGISRDVTEQVQMETDREEQRRMLKTLLDTLPDIIVFKDTASVFRVCNQKACDLYGLAESELIGKTDFDLYPPDLAQAFREEEVHVMTEGTALMTERQLHTARASIWEEAIKVPMYDERGRVVGILSAARDISDRKRMEYELLRAQKLESVGILAGGIAHDFNNLLTAILGNLSLVREEALEQGHEQLAGTLMSAERATLRAKDLTHQLLTFARGGVPVKKVFSLAEPLREWTQFALHGSNVRYQVSVGPDLWPVNADEGQISQAINNLVINAQQAMPNGGTVYVSIVNFAVPHDTSVLKAGKYVEISVRDQGIGIPEEHLLKVFDPYFTTKQKGSGLGLTTTYSIVKNHGGHIGVESVMGEGTTFYVYLPASEEKPGVAGPPAQQTAHCECARILLMDDEEDIRVLGKRMLVRSGYVVELAVDGSEAIRLFCDARERREPFDLVILDLTIPGGMGGEETIRALRTIDPNVKAIVSSGYSTEAHMADYARYGFNAVIPKPYQLDEIRNTVFRILHPEDDAGWSET